MILSDTEYYLWDDTYLYEYSIIFLYQAGIQTLKNQSQNWCGTQTDGAMMTDSHWWLDWKSKFDNYFV